MILLGVALGTALALGGLDFGVIPDQGFLALDSGDHHRGGLCPVHGPAPPGAGAEPARKGVRRGRTVAGGGNLRIIFREILPNLSSSVVVFIPLMIANAILLEAALSFLGAGVRPPNPSWGTMIGDGIRQIPSARHLTLIPGRMLVLAVLGINVFGDGVRDALDPRARCAWSTDGPVHRTPAARDVRGAVRDLGLDVPDLPRHSQRGSGAFGWAGVPHARDTSGDPRAVGLRQADLRAVREDDEEDLHRQLISYSKQIDVEAEINRDLPATLSLAIGAGIIWLGFGIVFGMISAVKAGKFAGTQPHGPIADRRLDAQCSCSAR